MFSPEIYYPTIKTVIFLLCSCYAIHIIGWSNNRLLGNQNNLPYALILMVGLVLFLGFRPISGRYFGDTVNYTSLFEAYQENPELAFYDLFQNYNESRDKLFTFLMITFARFSSVEIFFTFVELVYVGCSLWACNRLIRNNPFAAFIILVGSFSFFSYGVNGIRNGAALAIVLVAISYLDKKFWYFILSVILCLIAYNIHSSSALPSLMLFISFFIVRDFKWALGFWLFSIVISLTLGNSVASIFEGLGFDDRLDKYISGAEDDELMANFSHTGFRWDFLLYSCVPIVIGYYSVLKKNIKDITYVLLLNTYTLSNAFWIMIIRSSFSNRFAYLSWFMYPLVLCYPFLKLNIWERQSSKVGLLLMLNILFTILAP